MLITENGITRPMTLADLPKLEAALVATAPESGATPGVAAVATCSASSRDITEDEEYQKFVESMVQYCRCTGQPRPCDGVLAGGLCDNIHDDRSWGDDDIMGEHLDDGGSPCS